MSLELYNYIIGAGTIGLAIIIVALCILRLVVGKKSSLLQWIYQYSVVIGLFVGGSAVVGSIGYSDLFGLPPCVFCWWQRIFLYPQLIIFLVALFRHGNTSNARDTFYYSIPMAIISSIISLYHVMMQQGIIGASGACLENTVSCTIIDIQVFGFLTIPMMALVLGVTLVLLGIFTLNYNKQ